MNDRSTYINGLRALADLLEAKPDLPPPSVGTDGEISWHISARSYDNVAETIAMIARLIPGRLEKNSSDDEYGSIYFELSGSLAGLPVKIWTFREDVCRKVVTGTREVQKQVPVGYETVTETVDVFGWECEPILAKAISG